MLNNDDCGDVVAAADDDDYVALLYSVAVGNYVHGDGTTVGSAAVDVELLHKEQVGDNQMCHYYNRRWCECHCHYCC